MTATGKPVHWHHVWSPDAPSGRFNDIGTNPDGSLWNPNGYPEDAVRAALAAAAERQHRKRSEAARKAATTRARRRERNLAAIVAQLRSGGVLAPADACRLCGKALDDPESIARGIGSDCWQDVLTRMETAPPALFDARNAEDSTDEKPPASYDDWFRGSHQGTAPAGPEHGTDGARHMNGVPGMVDELSRMRRSVGWLLEPEIITRDDQFTVLLQLHDAIGEAIDDLLAIGWPVRREDGTIKWTSAGSRPIATTETAAWDAAGEP